MFISLKSILFHIHWITSPLNGSISYYNILAYLTHLLTTATACKATIQKISVPAYLCGVTLGNHPSSFCGANTAQRFKCQKALRLCYQQGTNMKKHEKTTTYQWEQVSCFNSKYHLQIVVPKCYKYHANKRLQSTANMMQLILCKCWLRDAAKFCQDPRPNMLQILFNFSSKM